MILTDDEIRNLSHERARASRLQGFLETEFWIRDLGPYLQAEQDKNTIAPIDPRSYSGDSDKVLLQYFFNSGMIMMVKKIMEDFSIWREKGKSAAERLRLDSEQRAKVRQEA